MDTDTYKSKSFVVSCYVNRSLGIFQWSDCLLSLTFMCRRDDHDTDSPTPLLLEAKKGSINPSGDRQGCTPTNVPLWEIPKYRYLWVIIPNPPPPNPYPQSITSTKATSRALLFRLNLCQSPTKSTDGFKLDGEKNCSADRQFHAFSLNWGAQFLKC